MLTHNSEKAFFQIIKLGNFKKILIITAKKYDFFAKKSLICHFLTLFWSKFSKIVPKSKKLKKKNKKQTFLEKGLNMIFKQF